MVEIDVGPIEIDIELRHKHRHWLLAAIGPFTVTGDSNNMASQVLTVQNTSAPSITSVKIGPYEKFNAAGDDQGPDTLAVVAASSDTTKATVATDPDGTSTVTFVPDTSGSVNITFDDSAAGGSYKGEIDITLLVPAGGTLVATIGAPVVTG